LPSCGTASSHSARSKVISIRWRCWSAARRSIARSMPFCRRFRAGRSYSIWAMGCCRTRRSLMSSTSSRGSADNRHMPEKAEDPAARRTAVNTYAWIKAFHIIAVIAWMAGMLYLPRLFVYHCGAEKGSVQSETFKVMERRLLRAIINPAMIATWLLGLWLVWLNAWMWATWFQLKFVLVIVMSGVHGMLARYVRDFAADANRHSEKFYRIINEVPTILMIGIVLLAVLKPF